MLRRSSLVLLAAALSLTIGGCKQPEVRIEETPIKVVSDTPGFGIEAEHGKMITLDYQIERTNGHVVLHDDRYRFVLGDGSVIRGIDEAVVGMLVGGTRVVECPPHKHWGRAGYGGNAIPPNETLMMRLKLIAVSAVDRSPAAIKRSTDTRRYSVRGER